MIRKTPTERLEWLLTLTELAHAHGEVANLLQKYEEFLRATNADESELVKRFLDAPTAHKYMTAAYEFGDLVFKLLNRIGHENRFHRILVV